MATADKLDPAPSPRAPRRAAAQADPARDSLWSRMVARWRMQPESLDDYDARRQ